MMLLNHTEKKLEHNEKQKVKNQSSLWGTNVAAFLEISALFKSNGQWLWCWGRVKWDIPLGAGEFEAQAASERASCLTLH